MWIFIKTSNNSYIIKNKNQCYLKIIKFKIICEDISFEEATKFNLIKIYNEIIKNKNFNKIIGKGTYRCFTKIY